MKKLSLLGPISTATYLCLQHISTSSRTIKHHKKNEGHKYLSLLVKENSPTQNKEADAFFISNSSAYPWDSSC